MGKFLDIAQTILKNSQTSLTPRQITDQAHASGLLEFSNGETPYQTMKAKLAVDIRRFGDRSAFKRTGPNRFCLRDFGEKEYNAPAFHQVIKKSENALVFPAQLLSKVGWFHGINKKYRKYENILLDPKNTRFIKRLDAENDLTHRQIVSYVLVERKKQLLRFVRGKYVSAQAFLKGRYCIGFGGHAQESDYEQWKLFSQKDSGYNASVQRVLEEELKLPKNSIAPKNLKIIGVLNDDSSDVGKRHFAFIHKLNLDHIKEEIISTSLKKEKAINQLTFVPIKNLGKNFERYEYWSKLCVGTFFKEHINLKCVIQTRRRDAFKAKPSYIAIVGAIGSGKTEGCNILQKKFGYNNIRSGEVVKNILNISAVKKSERMSFQEKAHALVRSPDGCERIATAIYQRMKGERVVVDGIRNIKTFKILKKKLKDQLSLVYVYSTVDNSYKFSFKRDEGVHTKKEFLELIQHPVEKEIEEFSGLADVFIYNYGSLKSYAEVVTQYFSREFK